MREPEMGLYLRLRVERGTVAVEAAAPIRRWSQSLLRPPTLTRETYRRFASPGAETVLSLLDAGGRVLESFAFSETPQVFFDRPAPGPRRVITGNTGDPRQTVREIDVPFKRIVQFLNFHRSELTFVRRGDALDPELRQQYVSLYATARAGEPILPTPPLPFPPIERVRALPLPWLPPRGERGQG